MKWLATTIEQAGRRYCIPTISSQINVVESPTVEQMRGMSPVRMPCRLLAPSRCPQIDTRLLSLLSYRQHYHALLQDCAQASATNDLAMQEQHGVCTAKFAAHRLLIIQVCFCAACGQKAVWCEPPHLPAHVFSASLKRTCTTVQSKLMRGGSSSLSGFCPGAVTIEAAPGLPYAPFCQASKNA